MILLVLVASVLIAGVTIYQYGEQAKDYHQDRLERKEEQIKENIRYTLRKTTYVATTENLDLIFKDEIYEIADVLNVNFNIYDLEGGLIKSSRPKFGNDSISMCLTPSVLNHLKNSVDARYLEEKAVAGNSYQASYTYILDNKFKRIGILNLPYFEDNSFNDKELKEFLVRLAGVYVLMLLIAIWLAFFISKFITRSLQDVSDRMNATFLTNTNEKIRIDNPSSEIEKLIDAYNAMIDELEISAIKLAKSEREQAWREMAKQVAHEIKNPLTPMRLTVQSFERKFNADDPDIKLKITEYSKTLIQQIDTMSSIAGAFSNFAQMPAQQNETLNVVKIVKLGLDIFNENYIRFIADDEEIIAELDRTQLIRVVTNLVKNAIQAVPDVASPRILVTVSAEDKFVKISVADNGVGITEENKDKIFEPKFTTKTSGMGLGLGMVKNIVETYNGSIDFTSLPEKGTVFVVKFPRV
ncbi:GHKL domain-containing protein [Cellulophaga baltica]|uniref:sensor histidine kinase n=1 Tax=Cellulophaga TaxID=104264 RepID=UPI001C06C84E|nr:MULTISPECIES: ATP-binding protein [Cellulophaga]MBU2997622.1 GHKL domain-containing protein [Cellulophaga baltica]MDO6769017.1 ATP-binding protein [Cellulophaga sp. 1_MG-2023]